MTKDDIIKELGVLSEKIRQTQERMCALEKENEALKVLIQNGGSPVRYPTYQPDPYGPPFKVTC